ncbi:MAG: nitroreductase family protein, partial [DPANN group archaeon]|nr:nitroreductase family protein [DPANN group archaeon]
MDTFDCIRTRRSVRKFHATKIPEEALYAVLDAANLAPCAGNLQTWQFLVVEDEAKKKVIAEAALEQDWIAKAPTVILLLSNPNMTKAEFGDKVGDTYDNQNVMLAAENLILAAWNLGIGSTFVGSFTESRLRKEFKIPAAIKIHAIIPLGYPAEINRPLGRAGIEDFTHIDDWNKKIRKERRLISALVYPEKEEVRFGELAEATAKRVIEKVK